MIFRLLCFLIAFWPALAFATCSPAGAPSGSPGCMQNWGTPQSSDLFMDWRPSGFPNAIGTVTLPNLATGIGGLLAPSATTDTTNAANISSGLLPSGRLLGVDIGASPTALGRTLAQHFQDFINVKDAPYNAQGNTITKFTGVTIAASSNALHCIPCQFGSQDVGKAFILDGAGANGAPLTGTISSVTDALDVVLSTPAALAAPTTQYSFVVRANVAQPQSGSGSYAPGDTITLTGGTASQQAILTVQYTKVQSAAIASGGSGGANGQCYVQGTTGTVSPASATGLATAGNLFLLDVVVSGGAITSINKVYYAGSYSANPTSLTAEPVAPITNGGCAGLTGATVSLNMGVFTATVTNRGNYSVTPSIVPGNYAAQGSTSGSGTGATFFLDVEKSGVFTYGTDDSAAFAAAETAAIASYNANVSLPAQIRVPPGSYLLKGTPGTLMIAHPVQIIGAGSHQTGIVFDPNYSGPAFSYSEVWAGSGLSLQNGSSTNVDGTGLQVRGITFYGDMTSPNEQDGIVLYDREDQAYISDVNCLGLQGACLSVAHGNREPAAYNRESDYEHIKAWKSGTPLIPAIDIYTLAFAGNDACNELSFRDINVFSAGGVGIGLRIPSNAASGSFGMISFSRVRVEQSTLDDFDVGEPQDLSQGKISTINLYDTAFLNPGPLSTGFRLDGGISSGNAPNNIQIWNGSSTNAANTFGSNIDLERGFFITWNGILGSISPVPDIVVGSNGINNYRFDGPNRWTWTWSVSPSAHNPYTLYGSSQFQGLPTFSEKSGEQALSVTTSGSSAVRLVEDSSGTPNTYNCFNPGFTQLYNFALKLSAFDTTTVANWITETIPLASMRDTFGTGSVSVNTGEYSTITNGTGASAVFTIGSDTTNGCPSIQFTPPSGNTDTWTASARVEYVYAP